MNELIHNCSMHMNLYEEFERLNVRFSNAFNNVFRKCFHKTKTQQPNEPKSLYST